MIKITRKRIIVAAVAATVIFLFAMFGPPDLFNYTSTPAFCNSCHVMKEQHETWFLTGVHREITCVDCHLPNNNMISYTVSKGVDGTKDVLFFYTRFFPEHITASGHAKKVIQRNCVRCHGEMVSRISTDDRTCWSCHRRVNHKFADFSYSSIK